MKHYLLNSKTPKRLITLMITSAALALSACGGSSYVNGGRQNQTPAGNNSGTGSNGTGGTTVTINPDLIVPSISSSFSISGTDQNTSSSVDTSVYLSDAIYTDSLLKVRITARAADKNLLPGGTQYTNFQGSYSCASYTVSIVMNGTETVIGRTKTLKVQGQSYTSAPCGTNPPESQVIDLSSKLYPGHPPVQVKISKVKTDYYCYYLGTYYPMYADCTQLRDLYQYHVATGDIELQVNGSSI